MKSLLMLLALAMPIFAQTADVVPFTKSQYVDSTGAPCNSCQIWTYQAGTTTVQATYTTSAGNVANPNPVPLNAAGQADIFLGPYSYKLVLETAPLAGQTHGAVIWTEDNIKPLGLIAYNANGGTTNACTILYNPSYTGSNSTNLCNFLGQTLDVRNFGAVGVQGNCHSSSINDQPAIQAALNYAAANGPLDVLLPPGYCWPILTHVWVPPLVRFHGIGRTSGYEISSPGSLLIANTGWASTNTSFPYSQMVWATGDNFVSGTFAAKTVSFATEIDHLEINCNDAVGCGNFFAVGRQEKSAIHDVVMSGGVPFAGGYSYGFFEQGVDCNGATPPANGCLIATSGSAAGNPFSGQQGPDYHLEIFPSYNAPSSGFIPFVEMGASNYKGLRDSTLNCVTGASSTSSSVAGYFWGSDTTMGPGIHVEQCGTVARSGSNQFVLGNIPAGTGCNGADHLLFTGTDAQLVISSCAAQTQLSFLNIANFYVSSGVQSYTIINNQSGAPDQNISSSDYYFDSTSPYTAGPLGVQYGWKAATPIVNYDPGSISTVGYNPFSAYSGTAFSGFNAGNASGSATGFTRAYSCGNLYWNNALGQWPLGGDGATDYSCILHLNGGNLGLSSNNINTNPTMTSFILGNVRAVASGAGHFLVGSNWLNTSTGLTTGENTAALQVHGGISGDVQMGSSSTSNCPTTSTSLSTCTFNVTWATAYTNSTYPVVCSLMDPTGVPAIRGVTRTNTGVSVIIQNVGAGSTSAASGGSGVSCWATPTAVP